MQKNFKIAIILIGLIFLSTGCNAEYEATITNDSIKEKISVSEESKKAYENAYIYKNGNLDNFYNNYNYLKDYKNYKVNEYVDKFYLNKANYERDNYVYQADGSPTYHYILNNHKKDLSLKNNFFINNIVRDSIIVNDNNIILHLDNIPSGLLDEVDDLTVTINTELAVISNNADTVDGNYYTWKIDKNNYKTKTLSMSIERLQQEIKEDNNKKNNNTSMKKNSVALYILFVIGIYLAIIIFVINIFNKKKKLF